MSSPKASYVSALIWDGIVLNTEIQLAGKGDGTLLAERLAGDVTMVRCFLFVNLGTKTDIVIVKMAGSHKLQIKKSIVNLGTGLLEQYLT